MQGGWDVRSVFLGGKRNDRFESVGRYQRVSGKSDDGPIAVATENGEPEKRSVWNFLCGVRGGFILDGRRRVFRVGSHRNKAAIEKRLRLGRFFLCCARHGLSKRQKTDHGVEFTDTETADEEPVFVRARLGSAGRLSIVAERVIETGKERIGVQPEDTVEEGVVFAAEQQVRSSDHNAALRIAGSQVSREKQLVGRIGGEQNSELDVMLLQFADDAEQNRFLRERCEHDVVGRDGVVVISGFVEIEGKSGASGRLSRGRSLLLLRSNFLLIGGTKVGNLSRKVEADYA